MLALLNDGDKYYTAKKANIQKEANNYLEPVFINGAILRNQHFQDIRNMAHNALKK